MNKYRISKNVDTTKSTSPVFEIMKRVGINYIPIVGPAITIANMNSDVIEISTLDELNTYSCVGSKWDNNCIYVEHPIFAKRLIDAQIYKDYILKELLSEIFDYITDNIAIKEIVLGVEKKSNFKAKASVPINELVADAQMAGALDQKYIIKMEDIDSKTDSQNEYPWLAYYPDIVSAVKKSAGKLEIVQNIKLDLDVSLGLQNLVGGNFKSEKIYNFYVYYKKA